MASKTIADHVMDKSIWLAFYSALGGLFIGAVNIYAKIQILLYVNIALSVVFVFSIVTLIAAAAVVAVRQPNQQDNKLNDHSE